MYITNTCTAEVSSFLSIILAEARFSRLELWNIVGNRISNNINDNNYYNKLSCIDVLHECIFISRTLDASQSIDSARQPAMLLRINILLWYYYYYYCHCIWLNTTGVPLRWEYQIRILGHNKWLAAHDATIHWPKKNSVWWEMLIDRSQRNEMKSLKLENLSAHKIASIKYL